MAPSAGQGGVQPLVEHGPVGQPGQRVVMRQKAQFGFGLVLGGNVPRHADAGLGLL